MPPVDLVWTAILSQLQVPAYPNLFVLGSFARRVTVYSQQLRALNLADALCSTGRVRHKTSVAVIGAGAAGLTVAAALIKMGALHVRLFEEQLHVLPIQKHSRARFLHPHLYDWPYRKFHEAQANLPVLDWSACYASDLAARFAEEWRELCASRGVSAHAFGTRVQLRARDGQVSLSTGGRFEHFDIVIVATGFGVELGTHSSFSYWEDLPVDGSSYDKGSWFVSGAGDGALTDVMRLGIRGLNHRQTLERVVQAAEAQPGALAHLTTCLQENKSGPTIFDQFDASEIARRICGEPKDARLRDDPIALNADESALFGDLTRSPGSSVLNRLITWVLLRQGKIELRAGKIDVSAIVHEHDRWRIPLGGVEYETKELLIRHGPVHPLPEREPRPAWIDGDLGLWRSLRSLRRKWSVAYERSAPDTTLQREHWASHDFVSVVSSLDFDKTPAVLLQADPPAGAASIGLKNNVDAAVRAAKGKDKRATHAVAKDALAGARRLGHMVRLMCEVPIVVVDLTKQDAALLLLLGIRAACRRGITVAIISEAITSKHWEALAFNLRSLRIVADADPSSDQFGQKLAVCLQAGDYRSTHRSDYLDLPVFDVVRGIGGRPDDYVGIRARVQTMVLCPFDIDYAQACWPQVQRAVKEVLGSEAGDSPARRAIDLQSLEILERRLYEAIRRCEACVVDLTLDWPNVYFELGVRLAVNSSGAILVRASEEYAVQIWPRGVQARSESSQRLDALLGTATYGQDDLPDALRARGDADLSRGFIFNTVRDVATTEGELGGQDVPQLLRKVAASAVGPDPIKDASSPQLFATNPAVLAQARKVAFESKLALALYLTHRPREPSPQDIQAVRALLNELETFEATLDLPPEERAHLRKLMHGLRPAGAGGVLPAPVEQARSARLQAKAARSNPAASVDDLKKAMAALDEAITVLMTGLECEGANPELKRDFASEIADCLGVKGGTLRHLGRFAEAASAYGDGAVKEEYVAKNGGRPNSYCLLQHLVNLVLHVRGDLAAHPKVLGIDLAAAFAEARGEVVKQIETGGRSLDPWALADVALLDEIQNHDEDAERIWAALEALKPTANVYQSTADALSTLFGVLAPHEEPARREARDELLAWLHEKASPSAPLVDGS